ncbi:MAG: hypothetical protein FWC89_01970 [Defluviitaleaceae bacterium]|nr:hypothetical protein [Defluviitaleaceae bacterium]
MLRPIDMTLTIQGSAEANRAGQQGALAGRPEVSSQMFADRLEKQVKQQQEQVVQGNKAEKNDVNPDRQGHGGGYQPQRKKKPDDKAKAGVKSKPTGESLYDIKV